MLALAENFSELGRIKAKKNGWSGGSYTLEKATIVAIDTKQMELEVTVQERSKPQSVEKVTIDLGKCVEYSTLTLLEAPLLKCLFTYSCRTHHNSSKQTVGGGHESHSKGFRAATD